jgi:hypothetical protein
MKKEDKVKKKIINDLLDKKFEGLDKINGGIGCWAQEPTPPKKPKTPPSCIMVGCSVKPEPSLAS